MSVKIQRIPFDDDDVIISVGFFLAGDIVRLFRHTKPLHVEAYEPRIKIYVKYIEAGGAFDAFVPIQRAVGRQSGTATFQERSTRSTICKTNDRSRKGNYEVDVVSMTSVLEAVYRTFGRIDKLLINCEGSEIAIIKGTPIAAFALCKYIFVQFHDFLPFLQISKADVQACVDKLTACFELRRVHRKYSKYDFRRRY